MKLLGTAVLLILVLGSCSRETKVPVELTESELEIPPESTEEESTKETQTIWEEDSEIMQK